MKKKLLALLVVGAIALTGCSKEANVDNNDGEETVTYAYSVQTRGLDETELVITSVDEDGEKSEERTDSYVWFSEGGEETTIGKMMEEWGIEAVEPVCEGYDFIGWRGYKVTTETDEEGFSSSTEELIFDGKVFSTEEMMAQPLPESDVIFYTEWDFTCGGCEEHKLCTVYYIDDGRYFVCDDCYNEFATGMGLIDVYWGEE